MGGLEIQSTTIRKGVVSRLIKKSWVKQDGVQSVAFDLRERTPPELYVSFSLTCGGTDDEHLVCAYTELSRKFAGGPSGFIALFDIPACLEAVNDEEFDIICFRDEKLPHCGLHYLTEDLRAIQEAKTTLAFLANERLHAVSSIKLIGKL